MATAISKTPQVRLDISVLQEPEYDLCDCMFFSENTPRVQLHVP